MVPLMSRAVHHRNRCVHRLTKVHQRKFIFELLESRAMMAADLGSTVESQQVADAIWLAKSRVSPLLTELSARVSGASVAATADTTLSERIMFDNQGRVDVHFAGQDVLKILDAVKQIGFEPLYVEAAHQSLDGFLPVSAIPRVSEILANFSVGVSPNLRPMTGAGSVTSEADTVLQSRRLRESIPSGLDGTGIRIGVLSDSYNNRGGAAADIASGDLPANVTVVQDLASGGSDEGRAMLQLVYDVAPASTLGFATAFGGGQAGFAANIRALASANSFNADVITDDVFYFAEPYFQDGLIAQAIDDVVQNSDVAYFALAGNLSDQAFELNNPTTGAAVTFGATNFGVPSFTSTTAIDLDPGVGSDTRQSITLNNGQRAIIGLQWDSPFFASVSNDLDIFLVDQSTNQLVALAAADNIASDEPVEVLGFTNTTGAPRTYEIIVDRFSGPMPSKLKWVNFGANNSGAISTIEYDTNSPTVIPHSAAVGAMSVGAVPYFDQLTPESFTSAGPATILFSKSGVPITPTIRAKPDIASIDGINTTFFGGDFEGDGRPNFFGTSAAAPHAAAVGALVRQANPTFTASQVYDRMKQTALDISVAGNDNLTGAGLINAFKAVYPIVVPSTIPTSIDFESGINQQWEVYSTNNGKVVSRQSGGPDGKQLAMDTFFGFNNSLNEAILHFNAGGIQDVQLSFDQREFADEDNPMPATFSGRSLADGVAMSVDGINWVRVVSLTGANSTATQTTRSFNLGQIALANGLTLGSDVRIKFQQYDNSPILSDGMIFDNIIIAKAPNQPPSFAQASYSFSFPENLSAGAPVGSVSATDPNLGDVLTFGLSGSGANNFVINASTGAITVAAGASLNAVLNPSYSLTASVSDGQVSVNVPVTFNVTAVNEVTRSVVYYKGSSFAGLGVASASDPSIAIAKSGNSSVALGFANLTSTSLGINGVVLDIARMPSTSLTAADFVFRMSPTGLFDAASNPPRSWTSAPSPTGIFVTPATATTPARVRVEWNNGQIANRWLQLQVLNTAQTGLPVTQVFYLGNLQGELNGQVLANAFFVSNADLTAVNPIGSVATVSERRDIDKNRFVLNSDGVLIRNSINAGLALRLITIPAAGSADEGRVGGSTGSSGTTLFAASFIGIGSGSGGNTIARTSDQLGNNLRDAGSSLTLRTGIGLNAKAETGSQPLVPLKASGLTNANTVAPKQSTANNQSISVKSTADRYDAVFSELDNLDDVFRISRL